MIRYFYLFFMTLFSFTSLLAQSNYKTQEIFRDYFHDNRNDWRTGSLSDGDTYIDISNGYYNFEHKNEVKAHVVTKPIKINQYKNFQIDASIKKN